MELKRAKKTVFVASESARHANMEIEELLAILDEYTGIKVKTGKGFTVETEKVQVRFFISPERFKRMDGHRCDIPVRFGQISALIAKDRDYPILTSMKDIAKYIAEVEEQTMDNIKIGLKREVFFRAKQKWNKKWRYGQPLYSCDQWYIREEARIYPIETDTVGECTGLRDKNGKMIFEGDILKAHFDDDFPEEEAYAEVRWIENGFRAIEDGTPDKPYLMKEDCEKYWEVYGNIYDNPELQRGDRK